MAQKSQEKTAKEYQRYLKDLTTSVLYFLTELDRLMQQPSTEARGKQIAHLSNELELVNDRARYFGLGIDYRTDKKPQGKRESRS